MSYPRSNAFKSGKEQAAPIEAEVKGTLQSVCIVNSVRIALFYVQYGYDVSLTSSAVRYTSGTIPSWLSGRLVRNGPGLFEVGDTEYKHWFDGLALLHSFTIADGKLVCVNGYWSVCHLYVQCSLTTAANITVW